MGSYVPSTLKEQKEMLESIGLSSIDELFAHIPDELKLKGELNIPSGKPEILFYDYITINNSRQHL